MFSAEESFILASYLRRSGQPEDTMTLDELRGYLFGLAMTPQKIPSREWLPLIFGGPDNLPRAETKEARQGRPLLKQCYERSCLAFAEDRLDFPFVLDELEAMELQALYEWVSGLEEALLLNERLWDPEEFPFLGKSRKQELYQSLMTIQGLVDPVEADEIFAQLPQEAFAELFSTHEETVEGRKSQLQMFLLASLPLAVKTLQEHARASRDRNEYLQAVRKTAKKGELIHVDFSKPRK